MLKMKHSFYTLGRGCSGSSIATFTDVLLYTPVNIGMCSFQNKPQFTVGYRKYFSNSILYHPRNKNTSLV